MKQSLPLAPFEHYMLADHRPAYPMNIVIRLRFQGCLKPSTLGEALTAALKQHPLFCMQAQERGQRWAWVPAQETIQVRWLNTPPQDNVPKLSLLDVKTEAGLRVYASSDQTRTDLILQAHHATCDGLGLLAFAEDLLVYYARVSPDITSPPPPQRDPQHLIGRWRLGLTPCQFWSAACRQVTAWRSILHFLRRSARPLGSQCPAADDAPPQADYPCALTQTLEREQTQEIITSARAQGLTFNDLLVTTLYEVLLRHQHQPQGEASPWLRLCIPVSFRGSNPEHLPAMNRVSLAFLNRRACDAHSHSSFQRSIHREMKRIKQGKQGLAFILGVVMGRFTRGGVLGLCRARRCQATAVLSNPGRIFAHHPLSNEDGQVTLGSTTLQGLDFLTPVRPKTHVAFATFTYADRLYVTLHVDPATVTKQQAQGLLNEFLHRLINTTH